MRLTENQLMLLEMANKTPGKWVSVKGVCLIGRFNGRGISNVLKAMQAKQLIDCELRNVGVRRVVYETCIRITTKGQETMAAAPVKSKGYRTGFPVAERFAVGDRVESPVSGWTGTIIAKNKQRSSPWKVRWDKNGRTSNVNAMVVRKIKETTERTSDKG